MSNHVFEEDLHQEMGLMTSYRWHHEPRGVLFMLARYKFVAKMLEGYDRVTEIGCGDGFGSRLVRPVVGSLVCTDIDPKMIESAKACHGKFGIDFFCTNKLMESDAIYAMDVVEHMPAQECEEWVEHISLMAPMVIIGSPSAESQRYASKLSAKHHINCMTGKDFNKLMKRHFNDVLMFSMNDEIVHTGFSPMSHYNIAIGMN